MLSSVVSTLSALRDLPRLADRVAQIEARAGVYDRTVRRVAKLEHDVDDVEALAREVNVRPRAPRGAST